MRYCDWKVFSPEVRKYFVFSPQRRSVQITTKSNVPGAVIVGLLTWNLENIWQYITELQMHVVMADVLQIYLL